MRTIRLRRPRLGLLATFGLAALVPIAGLALVLGHLLRDQVRDRAYDDTTGSAYVVAAALESQLSVGDLGAALPRDRMLALDGIVASLRARGFDGVTVWSRAGQVVYSTDRRLVGSRPAPSPRLRQALSGQAASGTTRPPGSDGRHARLDVLVPLGFGLPGPAGGALELVSPYRPLAAEIAHDTRVLYLLLLGGLAALYALLLPIVSRLSRRLRQHAEEKERLALHDPLTGLPNRSFFLERLRRAVAESDGRTTAVTLIDLDRFKEVNDTLGHHSGDELLRAVAHRLAGLVRAEDCFARLGGDEFALLLHGLADERPVVDVCARIARELERPFLLEGLPIEMEVSVGTALHPAHGDDAETLLRRADAAMYLAKTERRGHCIWSPGREDAQPAQLALIGELRRALEERELVLNYQPQARLGDGSVVAVEALVRWNHPTRGLLGPGDFIPLAQHTSLIRPLTLYVVEEALAQCRRWREDGLSLSVAVNVAPRNLLDLDFPESVRALVLRSGVEPEALELELTETAVLADPRRAADVLDELERIGVRLAIDDFGTGYSSLAYLNQLPVHRIKIDRSFVSAMNDSADHAAIVEATIRLGEALGLEVVAEGVETIDLWNRLDELGCHFAQGYFLGRPAAPDDLAAQLRGRERSVA
jgi:diguanylate cyclase (GGDEF)-like protein